jgi:CPA2 family monovalent cation:H+ antiporter-2
MSQRLRDDIDPSADVTLSPPADACPHVPGIVPVRPRAQGCEECLRSGGTWVHLRICMRCGHVGCCDSSPNRHATKHYHATGHPVVRSLEPGETWGWCYADEVML